MDKLTREPTARLTWPLTLGLDQINTKPNASLVVRNIVYLNGYPVTLDGYKIAIGA